MATCHPPFQKEFVPCTVNVVVADHAVIVSIAVLISTYQNFGTSSEKDSCE